MPRASVTLQCKAKFQMHMVPHGISGCPAGSASIGLAVLKMESTRFPFCRMEQPYGLDIWVDLFPMAVLYWAAMKHNCYMTGPRSAHRWKFNGKFVPSNHLLMESIRIHFSLKVTPWIQ